MESPLCPLKYLPKASLEVMSQLIGDDEGNYRLRTGNRVRYLKIKTDVFDEDTTCMPHLLIPKLPQLPDTEWTSAKICRGKNGEPTLALSCSALPGARNQCSSRFEDVLTLPRVERHNANVYVVQLDGKPAIAKIATFPWELGRIEAEIDAYAFLATDTASEASHLLANVLGHLTENGRIIGILLERLSGSSAGTEDYEACKRTLETFHRRGLVHGDVNRYNFFVDRQNGFVKMIDFEHSYPYEESAAVEEIESLWNELAEETGRGGPAMSREEYLLRNPGTQKDWS